MPAIAPLDTTAVIETPEHVRFAHRLAGPSRRAMAYALDALVKALALGALLLLLLLSGVDSPVDGASTGVLLVVVFLVEWGYFVFFETFWRGRSPGKRVLGLRVIKEAGHAVGFSDSVLRNLLRAADYLPAGYALGVFVSSSDPLFRRLGDMAAGTIVVVEEAGRLGKPLQIEPPPTAQELARVPARPALTVPELDAIERFLRRMGTLNPVREAELAALVAPQLAQRLGGLRYDSPARFLALLYHRARLE